MTDFSQLSAKLVQNFMNNYKNTVIKKGNII